MKFIVDILKFFTQIIPLLVELLESEKHRKEREAKQKEKEKELQENNFDNIPPSTN